MTTITTRSSGSRETVLHFIDDDGNVRSVAKCLLFPHIFSYYVRSCYIYILRIIAVMFWWTYTYIRKTEVDFFEFEH